PLLGCEIVTVAPSTGAPLTSVTFPTTKFCAAAGSANPSATTATRIIIRRGRLSYRQTMKFLLISKKKAGSLTSLPRFYDSDSAQKNASIDRRFCTTGAGGSDAMNRRP